MIVRDEAAVLQRCLDSLAGIHDELCIVDTGSRDGTLEIAERNGAKVRRFLGCNGADGMIHDFAAARNEALALASGTWILQIDADEVLLRGHDRIAFHVQGGKHDQIGVNLYSNGASWVSGRLFRRAPGVRYRSRIHEYLEHDGTFDIDTSIAIENIENKQGKESASDRNIRLCILATQEHPNEARNYHYLGNEYRHLQRLDEAIICYRKALELRDYRVGLFHTAYYLAICHFLKSELDEALAIAFDALRIDPRYAEAPCLIADIYSGMGNIEHARHWYNAALNRQTPPADAILGVQLWAYDAHPRDRLKQLMAQQPHSGSKHQPL